MSLFNLKVSSKIFKVDTIKDEAGIPFLHVSIKAKDGTWIEVEEYPDNPMGITAVLDLAVNVHSGKLMLKGLKGLDKRRITQ